MMKVGLILKSIMTTGTCFILITGTMKLVCLIGSPIDASFCIPYTTQVATLLQHAGFQIASTVSGFFGFFIFIMGVGKGN